MGKGGAECLRSRIAIGASAGALATALIAASPAAAQISNPQEAATPGQAQAAAGAAAAETRSQPQPSSSEAERQTAAATDSQGVPEIVVTAQFREQNLQDVPISISAVTAEQLLQRSVVDVTDVARSVPNVEMAAGASGYGRSTNQAYIRGLGQQDFLTTFEPRVGFYIDDVYFATTFGAVFDVLDLERVEVLRGPQGTLFGRNSVGGAIRIITRKPHGDNSGYLELTGGGYSRYQIRGAYDFALVPDVLMARITGSARGQDGWVDLVDYKCVNPNLGNSLVGRLGQGAANGNSCKRGTLGGSDSYNFRGSLRWVPSSTVDVLLQADYTRERDESAPEVIRAVSLSLDNPETGASGGATRAAFPRSMDNGLARYLRGLGTSYYGFDVSTPDKMQSVAQSFVSPGPYATYARYGNERVGYANPPRGTLRAYGGSLTVDIDLAANAHLTSISAYRGYKGDFGQSLLALPVEEVRNRMDHDQYTQEVRLLGSIGQNKFLEYTVGAFYIDSKTFNGARVQTEGFTNGLDFFSNDPSTLKAWAAYGAIDLHPVEGLTLSAGIRYSHERKTYTFGRDYSPSNLSVLNFTFTGRSKDDRWNPRFAISYEATDNLNLYASYATGFTASAYNGRPFGRSSVFALRPESVKTWEAGFKSNLLDRRLRFNAAAYYTNFKDIVGTVRGDATSPCPGVPFCNSNIGTAHIKGAEAELQAQPVPGLLLQGSVGYTDFKYTKLVANVTGLTLNSPNTRVPKWNLSGAIQYDIALGNGDKIIPRFDVSYRSRIYFTPTRANVSAQQAPFALANARITYQKDGNDWSVSAAVTNLFDKYYFTTITDQRESFGFVAGTVARPREWMLTLRKNF